MIDVVNLQRKVKLDTSSIRAFVADLSARDDVWAGKTFSVALISDRRMKQLNELFRGKDATTDVLSFPHEPDTFVQSAGSGLSDADDEGGEACTRNADFAGDIVISAEQAQKQAAENGLDLDTEIKQLILHGLLHLCGFDHETDTGEMDRREIELREQLGI